MGLPRFAQVVAIVDALDSNGNGMMDANEALSVSQGHC